MANPPSKHWCAIVDGGCWYIGYRIDRISAEKSDKGVSCAAI